MEEYKELFLSEAREHVESINNLLVILEQSNNDKETINKLFRCFHTLKGNSATMGYEVFSKLAHKLEDLLDLIRNGKIVLDKEIMDILFKGCDLLEKGLGKINENTPDQLDIKDVVEEVTRLIDQKTMNKDNSSDQKMPDVDLNKGESNKQKEASIRVDTTKLKSGETIQNQEKPTLNNSPNKLILSKEEEENIKRYDSKNIFRILIKLEESPLKIAKAISVIKKIEAFKEIKQIRLLPSREQLQTDLKTRLDFIIYVPDVNLIKKELNTVSKIKIDEFSELDINASSNTQNETKNNIIKNLETSKSTFQQNKKQTEEDRTKQQSHPEELKKVQEVKIDIKRLDKLMDMVGELLIHKMRLEDINKSSQLKELEEITNAISILTQNIQNEVIEERMIPVGMVFSRLPRIVRDLSHEQGKEIQFLMEGDDKKLDRTVIDKITDPLIHMIRNSVDHGIEVPNVRESFGKQKTGVIKLQASREKNSVIIEVEDDGQGIDPQKIKKIALERNVFTAEELNSMNDQKLQEIVFLPGFSTNDKITEISGRGVGMDVVMTNIKQVGGKVYLDSTKGKGTKVRIELPLTLAIIKVLLVGVKEEKYAIPLNNIQEIIDIKKEEIKTIQKKETFILRGDTIPLLRLKRLVGYPIEDNDNLKTIIVEDGKERIGIIVDTIENQQQILIKNVDDKLKKIKGIAGGTILGNGKVCFILDIDSLIKNK